MRIAYLMQYTDKDYDEVTENIDQFIDGGDDVYILCNESGIRDDMMLAYCDEPKLQIIYEQDGALPADLSMPRGFLVQMKKALEVEQTEGFTYDYFITLSDGMLPLVSREELVSYLNEHKGQDIYYEVGNSKDNEDIQRRFEDYAFFTNTMDFQKSRLIRGMNKMTSTVLHNFKQREFTDTIYQSYPWFILTHDSVQALAENIGYCSDTFKMSLYPEELALATMLHKFSKVPHHNENVWLCGKTADYQFTKPVQPLDEETIHANPGRLFGTKIHSTNNFNVYQNTFDMYLKKKD